MAELRPRHYAAKVLAGSFDLERCPPEYVGLIETHILCTIRDDVKLIADQPTKAKRAAMLEQVPAHMRQTVKNAVIDIFEGPQNANSL